MSQHRTNDTQEFPPSIEESIQLILSRMSYDMKEWLRGFQGDEVDLRVRLARGFTSVMSVRAILGLWRENNELLAQLPRPYQHPDDASSFFLIECWRRLKSG